MIEKFEEYFKESGFKKPTAIQNAVYDAMRAGKSVLGIAPTGSGKTIAFTLPALERLTPKQGIQMLVLSPSQELAMQTASVMRTWAKLVDLKVTALAGGANIHRQIDRLKQHPEIVIGTPGRILHLLDNRHLKLNQLQTLIIDEADDMLQDETLGVIEDIERKTPLSCQLGFFSATRTKVLDELKYMFGRDIIEYDVRSIDDTQGLVRHGLMQINPDGRAEMLRRFSHIKDFRALVFFNQSKAMHRAFTKLKHDHVSAAILGGDQGKLEREKALRMFRKRQLKFLLTTDVAARGLDIEKLPAVINYDLPKDAVTYVHRVGRTGRQGEPGMVVNFGNDHDLRDLKKLLADENYELNPIYFDHNRLVDEKPKLGEHAVDSRRNTQHKMRKQQHEDIADNGVQKKVSHTIDLDRNHQTKAKKKKKNRHQKDKGMRLKRRKQAEENKKENK